MMLRSLPGLVSIVLLARAGAAQELPGAESGFAQSDGVKLHYMSMGKGPLLILLHGFPDYWYTWRAQMPEWARHHQVVALDLRGYNLSDKPEGVEHYTMPKLTADVLAVANHFRQDRFTIIGHDWGGAIAWNVAMSHPERVERLVILNLPHPRGLMRELAANPDQQKASQYAVVFQQEGSEKAILPAALALWVTDPAARKHYAQAFQRSSVPAMLAYYKANYPRPPFENLSVPELPRVQCPTLVIHGLEDTALLPGALNDTWKWIDNELTLVTIPKAGHFVQQDAAERVAKVVSRWLAP